MHPCGLQFQHPSADRGRIPNCPPSLRVSLLLPIHPPRSFEHPRLPLSLARSSHGTTNQFPSSGLFSQSLPRKSTHVSPLKQHSGIGAGTSTHCDAAACRGGEQAESTLGETGGGCLLEVLFCCLPLPLLACFLHFSLALHKTIIVLNNENEDVEDPRE